MGLVPLKNNQSHLLDRVLDWVKAPNKELPFEKMSPELPIQELVLNINAPEYDKNSTGANLDGIISLKSNALDCPPDKLQKAIEALNFMGAEIVFLTKERCHWDNKKHAAAPHSQEYGRSQEYGQRLPGVNRISFVKRNPKINYEQFSGLWDNHSIIAKEHHPGISTYTQNLILKNLTGLAILDSDPDIDFGNFDGIAELYFDSYTDMTQRMYKDETSKKIVYEDIEQFLDIEGGSRIFAHQYVLISDL